QEEETTLKNTEENYQDNKIIKSTEEKLEEIKNWVKKTGEQRDNLYKKTFEKGKELYEIIILSNKTIMTVNPDIITGTGKEFFFRIDYREEQTNLPADTILTNINAQNYLDSLVTGEQNKKNTLDSFLHIFFQQMQTNNYKK
ncbi:MAG: hypothetical protein KKH40_01520, partial [Nanoarchaeota archaeon]|nr:hypothetical protein [Nanoarchaeota archaeon]